MDVIRDGADSPSSSLSPAAAGQLVRRAARAVLTLVFAFVGSAVGSVVGALTGLATESGVLRGAAIGSISGAVFCIEAVDSFLELWDSGEPGLHTILYVVDIVSSLVSGRIVWEKVSPALQRVVQSQMNVLSLSFMENGDLFETGAGGARGLPRELIDRIPRSAVTAASGDVAGQGCSVCLQEFGKGEELRTLPRCGHVFHVRCIDGWLLGHGTCPLCRRAVAGGDEAFNTSI